MTLTLASPANAASWHNISGETYSNTSWYYSDNTRVKAGYGLISAEFYYLPNYGGMRFGYTSALGSVVLGASNFTTTYNEQNLGLTERSSGYEFRNAFRRLQSCQAWYCLHTFSGREWY